MTTIYTAKGHAIQLDDSKVDDLCAYVWHVTSAGYVASNVDHPLKPGKRTLLLMHRRIMGLEFGDRRQVDHIDGDRLNNKLENLRLCNSQQNQWNQRLNRQSTTGLKGVYFVKRNNRWVAAMKIDGRDVTIGMFSDPMAAAHAYNKAAIAQFGEFAVLNPVCGVTEIVCRNRKPKTSLTTEQIDEVRASNLSIRTLAEIYDVHPKTIYRFRKSA
jgi:hypothetical protein